MYQFGARSKASLNGIAPALVKVMEAAITNSPIDFTITDGVRTAEQQAILYRKGRNAAGVIIDPAAVVTMCDGVHKKSNHQPKADGFGHAVDLYPYIDNAVDYDDAHGKMKELSVHIKKIAEGLEIPITWGGDWTIERDGLVDKPHYELKQ